MLGRKSLVVFLGSVVSSSLSFICLFLITNYIGAAAYGSVTLVFSILATIGIVADFGISSAHVKKLSEGVDINDCVSSYFILKVNLLCFFTLISFFALFIWVQFYQGTITEDIKNIFVILLLFDLLSGLANIASITFQGLSQVVKIQFISVIFHCARLLMIIVIVFFNGDSVDLAITYFVAMIIMTIYSYYLLKKNGIVFIKPTLIRPYVLFAFPLALMSIVATLATNLDKVLIGFSLGELSVGYYYAAQTLTGVIAGIGGAVAMLTYPDFSKLSLERKYLEIDRKCWTAERYLSFIVMPLIIILILLPNQILAFLFGSEFADAGNAIRWLAVGTLLFVINQPYSTQIPAVGKSDILAKVTIVSYALSLIITIIAVPDRLFGVKLLGLGLEGAAISYLCFTLSFLFLTRIAVLNLTGTKFNDRMFIHFVGAVATYLIMSVIISLDSQLNIYSVIIYFTATSAIFYTMMALSNELKKSDILYFIDLLNIKKMINYILKEIRDGN